MGALKESRLVDASYRDYIISKIRNSDFYADDENIVMSIAFDPKSCGIPLNHCDAECDNCRYNPLNALLDPFLNNNRDRQYVITDHKTIDTMLDVIALLAHALKGSLQLA
jgi:hypothetical protein